MTNERGETIDLSHLCQVQDDDNGLNGAVSQERWQEIVRLAHQDSDAGYALARSSICQALDFSDSECPVSEEDIFIEGAEPGYEIVDLSELEKQQEQ
ncbi:MAG: hypothetical protein AAF243_14625 [Cyanobacteria bacterium P01_A01_bin.137]